MPPYFSCTFVLEASAMSAKALHVAYVVHLSWANPCIVACCGRRASGPIPSALGGLTALQKLFLYNNKLTGEWCSRCPPPTPAWSNESLSWSRARIVVNDRLKSMSVDGSTRALSMETGVFSSVLHVNRRPCLEPHAASEVTSQSCKLSSSLHGSRFLSNPVHLLISGV